MTDKERLNRLERIECEQKSFMELHARKNRKQQDLIARDFMHQHSGYLIERVQELEEGLKVRDCMMKTMESMALHREDKLMSALQSKSSYRKQRNRLEREVVTLKRQNKHREEVIKKAIHETYEGYDTPWIVETLQKALEELK